MMTLCEWLHYRARARNAEGELRDLRSAYESMKSTLRAALLRLDTAEAREAALKEYAGQVELERDDARREVDEVRGALLWLEGTFLKEGSA